MASTQTTIVLEKCRVGPPPGTEPKQLSFPLTFFDEIWLSFHEIQRLVLYEFPCSETSFTEKIIPSIKHSLSIALKHFLPLAGNLICPPHDDDAEPQIVYTSRDSVSLTFSQSGIDFDYLTANYARKVDDFHPLVPRLPPGKTREPDNLCKIQPLLALQVTLFPNRGISVGFVNHHAVGDASTIIGFIKAWASIHKHGNDDHLLTDNLLPVFDRSVIKYPSELDKFYWNLMKNVKFPMSGKLDKVRATYVISLDQVQMLKNLVLNKRPGITHVSAFTVTCAYVWTCLVRSNAVREEEVGGTDDKEYFLCSVECRARLDPPAPANYFGNCVGPSIAGLSHEQLIGNEGFVAAAESIGRAIREFVYKEGGVLADADKWVFKVQEISQSPVVGIAGSPKFDVYDAADYGWGKPKKFEAISIDNDKCSMSLSISRECEGGLEIGLSLPKAKLDAFASVFADGFKILQS